MCMWMSWREIGTDMATKTAPIAHANTCSPYCFWITSCRERKERRPTKINVIASIIRLVSTHHLLTWTPYMEMKFAVGACLGSSSSGCNVVEAACFSPPPWGSWSAEDYTEAFKETRHHYTYRFVRFLIFIVFRAPHCLLLIGSATIRSMQQTLDESSRPGSRDHLRLCSTAVSLLASVVSQARAAPVLSSSIRSSSCPTMTPTLQRGWTYVS